MKKEIMADILNYLKSYNIYFETASYEDIPHLTMFLRIVIGVREESLREAYIFMMTAWRPECITRNWVPAYVMNLRIYQIYQIYIG